jgi:hypothetical protein
MDYVSADYVPAAAASGCVMQTSSGRCAIVTLENAATNRACDLPIFTFGCSRREDPEFCPGCGDDACGFVIWLGGILVRPLLPNAAQDATTIFPGDNHDREGHGFQPCRLTSPFDRRA